MIHNNKKNQGFSENQVEIIGWSAACHSTRQGASMHSAATPFWTETVTRCALTQTLWKRVKWVYIVPGPVGQADIRGPVDRLTRAATLSIVENTLSSHPLKTFFWKHAFSTKQKKQVQIQWRPFLQKTFSTKVPRDVLCTTQEKFLPDALH